MIDLRNYNSLGAVLRATAEYWPREVCLIEADRERENTRFTYREFDEVAQPRARALQEKGFGSGSRALRVATNAAGTVTTNVMIPMAP